MTETVPETKRGPMRSYIIMHVNWELATISLSKVKKGI